MRRYLELWRLPSARLLIAMGIFGRLPAGVAPLALLLLVVGHTGSYTLGGAAVGVYGVATAVVAPLLGRFADRRGFTPVLVLTGLGYPLAVSGLVAVVVTDAPRALIFPAAIAAGGLLPLLTSSLRAIWTDITDRVGDDGVRQTAFALDAIAMEVVWIFGPVLVAGVVVVASPAFALVGAAVAGLIGSLAIAASKPSRRWRPRPMPVGTRRRNPLRARGMAPVLVASFALLFGTGSLEAAIPAFSAGHGVPAISGVLLAVWGVGSALGGLWFGSRRFRESPLGQYRWALLACAVGMTPLAFLGNAWLIGVVLFVGGSAIAPAITMQNSLVADLAPTGSLTEAFTWLTTVTFTAVAGGTAVGGVLVDHPGGVPIAFGLAAVTALVAWLVVSLPGISLRRPTPGREPLPSPG
jgi:MFS family permease